MKGIGIDIVNVNGLDAKVAKQILSSKEMVEFEDYLKSNKVRAMEFLAGRLAAKEAYLKAIGVGIYQGINLTEITIYKDMNGVPKFKGVDNAFLTVSHETNLAIAFVVIE